MKSDRTDQTGACASFRELADLAEGRTEAQARTRLEAHLASCARCARELEAIEEVAGIMRADRSVEPPAPVVARAIDLFQSEPLHERVRAWLADRVEELAHVVFDSSSQLAFATARGPVATRRLRFESDDLELDVQVEGRTGGGRITGQLLKTTGEARPLDNARFLVVAGRRPAAEGITDTLGEFTADIDPLDSIRIVIIDGGRAVSFVLPPTLGDSDDADRS
jgi:hypothetical protein